MADSMDAKVWTNHAEEQWEENKEGHNFNDDNIFRRFLLGSKGIVKVLDMGCGGSLWRKLFVGFDYHGVDQNENMIRYAKRRFPDIEDKYRVAPAENTGYKDGEFDLVFTSAVLQHNRHARKIDVVKEIHRILRPGGYYMCTENTFREDNYRCTFANGPWHEWLDDGYSFTCVGWEKFFDDHGFNRLWFVPPSEYLYQKK